MLRDDSAVGGFFEDLTVLLFVLVGVAVIVSASVWTAYDASDARAEAELGRLAEELLTSVLSELSRPEVLACLPTVEHIKGLDLFRLGNETAGDRGFCVSVVQRHPETAWLCSSARGVPGAAVDTGFASEFANALDSSGMVVIVEVMVLVW